MGLINKIFIGFKRLFTGHKVKLISYRKADGNSIEQAVYHYIQDHIPNAVIKENVLLHNDLGRGEIDSLIQVDNRLFIVEVKHWKGVLVDKGDTFTIYKNDKAENMAYEKQLKSPFVQLEREMALLKEETQTPAYINGVVFFYEAAEVKTKTKITWFQKEEDLLNYLKKGGQSSQLGDVNRCMEKAHPADIIYSSENKGERSIHGRISSQSLIFKTNKGLKKREDIQYIMIKHHFTYDKIIIYLKNKKKVYAKNEMKSLRIDGDGHMNEYPIAKIDKIILG